jgi:uroporphyrinogen-III synthase
VSISNGVLVNEGREVDLLHEIGSRIAAANPLREVLGRVVEFISDVAQFDSCFVYVLKDNELVLRASKNPHEVVLDRLRLQVGRGITGWVAEHKRPVAISRDAFKDPRFQSFNKLPENRFEPFPSVPVLSSDKLVGVINLQQRERDTYNRREIRLISTIGFLVGAEIEMARLEDADCELSEQMGARKAVERAKGIFSVTSNSLLPHSSEAKPQAQKIPTRSSRSHRPKRRNHARPIQVRNQLAARDETYWRTHHLVLHYFSTIESIMVAAISSRWVTITHTVALVCLFGVLIPSFAHHR